MLGTEWSRFELSRAAKRVVAIADAIVHTDCVRQFPNLVRIPEIVVDAVVHWPFAAWPQSSPGMYDLDEAHMKLMNDAFATAEGTAAYICDYVDGYSHLDGYLDLIGDERRATLQASSTSFLLESLSQMDLECGHRAAARYARDSVTMPEPDGYTRLEMMAIAAGRNSRRRNRHFRRRPGDAGGLFRQGLPRPERARDDRRPGL